MRTTSFLLLTILSLALTVSAQAIYSEGPIDGNDNAFFVTGPNLPNFLGSFQDISNGFVAANSGTPGSLEWGEWSVGAPTSFSYEMGTSAFGTDIGSGTVAQNPANSMLLFTNGFGYGVYNVNVIGITCRSRDSWQHVLALYQQCHRCQQRWYAGVGHPERRSRRSCDLQLPAERDQLWRLRTRRRIVHAD